MKVRVSLAEEQEIFIAAKIASGEYASASEVVADALRLLEVQQQDDAAKLEWLREAYRIGIESGDASELNIEEIFAEARTQERTVGKSRVYGCLGKRVTI